MNPLALLAIFGGAAALMFARKGQSSVPRKGETWLVSMQVGTPISIPPDALLKLAQQAGISEAVVIPGTEVATVQGKLTLTADNQIPLTVEMGGMLITIHPVRRS